jgi:hypothetical protein
MLGFIPHPCSTPVLDTLFLTTPRDPVEPQQSGRTHPVLTDPRTNYHDTRLASSGASCSMGEDKVGGDAPPCFGGKQRTNFNLRRVWFRQSLLMFGPRQVRASVLMPV